jgi:hypothetical protein
MTPDLNNVQALIVRSSRKPLTSILLFRCGDSARAKAFLRRWTPNAPAGRAPEVDGQPAFLFLFAWPALQSLLQGHAPLDVAQGRRQFEVFFVDPAQRPGGGIAPQLGFLGQSAPGQWWDNRFTSDDIQFAIFASFDTPAQKADYLDHLRTSAAEHDLTELQLPSFADRALSGYRPPNGRLHFDYRDGVTTPSVDWNDTGQPGTVNFREFVVGYPNDDFPVSPQSPGGWQDFARDGFFAGIAWIYQDVARFNTFLHDHGPAVAPGLPADKASELLAAKLMGRWRDGTPLSKFPESPPAVPALDDDFTYAADPTGIRCPVTAHIRVANCRDQPMKPANVVRFPAGPPRLIRRGFTYGPRLEGIDDDGVDRGVVGLFCFARVNEQFYTVLRWLQKTGFSEAFNALPNGLDAQDAMFGNRDDPSANREFIIPQQGTTPVTLQLTNFIRYKGVAVLFAPSIASLRVLATE